MKTVTRFLSGLLCLLLIGPQLYAQDELDVQIGQFPPVDLIETKLERGVSTTVDVERVLGRPAGRGGYLAMMDGIPRDVWYYHDINTSMIDMKGSIMRMHTHTQILLVYFAGDRLDGYKWFATSAVSRAKNPISGAGQ